MKQKRMKSIAVALIALLIAGAAIVSLKVEPAGKPQEDNSIQTAQGQEDDHRDSSDDPDGTAGDVGSENRDGGQNGSGDGQDQTSGQSSSAASGDGQNSGAASGDGQSGSGSSQTQTGSQKGGDEKQPADSGTKALKCTFEIRCDTLTDTSKVENEAILPYIPSDGTVLPKTEVEFTEGDTVFDALKKVCRDKDVQMEFRDDKKYTGGAYIEGIGYLYEFDGGPLSGWMYKVNGQFPNYGCGGYTLEAGDEVVWVYTCDLGTDVGDNSTW